MIKGGIETHCFGCELRLVFGQNNTITKGVEMERLDNDTNTPMFRVDIRTNEIYQV